MKETTVKFEFNYASLNLRPYSGTQGSSNQLLKSIINKLLEPDFPSEKKIVDRHKNQKKSTNRNLVIISNQYSRAGIRCFGRIALIKNKNPIIWKGKDVIEELEREENRRFIEPTNYVIHFSEAGDPILMHEFNSEGPRLSDIVYYLRQIATEYRLAKSIKPSLHLQTNYEELEKDIRNVFRVVVKVKAAYAYRHSWLKGLKELNDESGYRDVRLEFLFSRVKEDGNYRRNFKGLDMTRDLLKWIGKKGHNLAYMDDLKMTYQLEDEKIYDLDFLKNKAVSIVTIPLTDGKIYKTDDYKTIVGDELTYYLKTGQTRSQEE